MRRLLRRAVLIAISVVATPAGAVEITLFDWVFNVDGAITGARNPLGNPTGNAFPASGALLDGNGDPVSTTVDGPPFEGLSTSVLSIEIPGSASLPNHRVLAFFDFEIDEAASTFFLESGAPNGTPQSTLTGAPGNQSWEIDEPCVFFGDICDNVDAGLLDNTNGVPAGSEDDVSLALGWDFQLLPGDVATIEFIIGDEEPATPFFLSQTDPFADFTLYFHSNLSVRSTGTPPGPGLPTVNASEPGALGLLLAGVLGVGLARPRRSR